MTSFIRSLSACVVIGFAAPDAPGSETAFNNFGPDHGGFDYNWGLGWSVAGPNNGPSQFGVEQAFLFTPSVGGALSDIWVPIWYVPLSALPDEVTVRIADDTGSGSPSMDDVLEEWTLTKFEDWSAWSAPHHLVSAGGVELVANQTYWIWMEGGDTTWCGWPMVLEPTETLPHTLRREGEDWLPIGLETASAMRIDVVTAPACPADFNGDNVVNPADLAMLLAAWGDCKDCPQDINADGVVDPTDLAILLASWGACD